MSYFANSRIKRTCVNATQLRLPQVSMALSNSISRKPHIEIMKVGSRSVVRRADIKQLLERANISAHAFRAPRLHPKRPMAPEHLTAA